ncbi:hypothetical protein DJ568_11775 [Mucilaginibacter hurinus]|uniref:TonB C-terminal domain-containing protein n=1 Tax=Mucilaginibacter hurinus TaxID=2201324 RepID=A0A367GNS0_9SPHI|nr:M56 family metallopeptidase [Mucilaginibacter hurinus]RCH54496.1 hypothetical protein DJ568_11775 [Mucilaginibacter hurinus]
MAWWQYLLLANLYLALFYGFYVLLLRAETFFQLNRVYLVASAILSFVIPVIQADWVQNLFITRQVNYIIYSQPLVFYQYAATAEDNRITIGQILTLTYAAGIIFLTCRLLWQLLQLSRFVRQPQTTAFSFFKKINVDATLSSADIITAHEEVHAKQWHSADVIIMEAIMILNWFNPVVYFYRRAIKHIHEFIADSKVIGTGIDKVGYAMLLLNHTMNAPAHGLVNQFFNHSLLKKRIMMLQKNKSQRVKLFKYGLSAPLFALMIIMSSATINDSKAVKAINKTAENLIAAPAKATVVNTLNTANDALKDVINSDITTNGLMDKVLSVKKDSIPDNKDELFREVESPPVFPGGINAFMQFLSKNIHYPKEDRDNKIEGRVFLTFIVEKDGLLSNVKVLRGISKTLDAEALRVIRSSPKWKPGYQNGRAVRVQFTVPIAFSLNNRVEEKLGNNPNGIGMENAIGLKEIGIDEMPQFTGGAEEFSKYLGKNVRYPAIDRNNKVSGTVVVNFIVQEDGSLTNIKALRRPSLSLQNEAIRVLTNSPKWIPGKKSGKPVKVEMNVPVNFSLVYDETQPAEQKPDVANVIALGLDGVNVVGHSSQDKDHHQLILLDGNEISRQAMEALDPKRIKSMNVLTREDATKKYGERGKGGVVEITTDPNPQYGKVASDFFIAESSSRLNADPALRPLIIVDGLEKSYQDLQKINVKEIETISILKDAASIKQYGNKGRNGVLVVTTKRAIKVKTH